MVVRKRQDYGFNGFQVPNIPRGPRSARRRGPQKKAVEDGQICAFELLASLAGKLLQESASSSASSNASEGNDLPTVGDDIIKHERQDEEKPLNTDFLDQGSCQEGVFISEVASLNNDQKCILKEYPHVESFLEHTSGTTNFDCQKKMNCDVKTESLNKANVCTLKDTMKLSKEFPALTNSGTNVNFPSCGDPVPNASFSRNRNDDKLGSRDDDENFVRCNRTRVNLKAFKPHTRIGDRRIRKLLTSKYWKAAPKLKDYELSRVDGGTKPLYRKRKICYYHGKCPHDPLYKRRKLYDRSSVITSDGGFSSESVSNSPEKETNGNRNGSVVILHGANGVSPSVISHQSSYHSKDSHVKFSIKSFRIPELFIEVPETSTVGSLKRTVLEAVNAILGGGLRVGVVVQGKKVRDDNRTLLQTGIACKENLDTLGFSLEPNHVQAPPPICMGDPPVFLPQDTSQPISGPLEAPLLDSVISNPLPDPPLLTNSGNNGESNHELVSPNTDILTDNTLLDSKALVAVSALNVEALAMVPVNQKSRRSELVQRRTRRPFSVPEVEALVQAVEELGTGRWRDVKLRAFENADHRTYVDLKDKWKTLVHTAKISPQQRRGEPVPQELLDRVLAAHAFWSQHQAKQHGKQQSGTLKITKGLADRNGVEGVQLL